MLIPDCSLYLACQALDLSGVGITCGIRQAQFHCTCFNCSFGEADIPVLGHMIVNRFAADGTAIRALNATNEIEMPYPSSRIRFSGFIAASQFLTNHLAGAWVRPSPVISVDEMRANCSVAHPHFARIGQRKFDVDPTQYFRPTKFNNLCCPFDIAYISNNSPSINNT